MGVDWLVTTVQRLHFDRLRSDDRESRRLRLVSNSTADPSPTGPTPPSSLLDGLSERESAALVLRYVEDLSVADVADVADVMGSTYRATESLLQRAKRKVRASRRIS